MTENYWKNESRFREYNHPIVEYFSMQRLKEIEKYIKISPEYKILDIGAGNGFSSYYYEKYFKSKIVAGDYSKDMLFRNPVSAKLIMDGKKLPFKDNSFDVVNIWEVLHHIESPVEVLKEAYRVSKKYIILFEPNRYNIFQFLFALWDKEHRLVLKYSKKYIENILEESGFKIIVSKNVGIIFPNLMPKFLFEIIKYFPFSNFYGISCMAIAEK